MHALRVLDLHYLPLIVHFVDNTKYVPPIANLQFPTGPLLVEAGEGGYDFLVRVVLVLICIASGTLRVPCVRATYPARPAVIRNDNNNDNNEEEIVGGGRGREGGGGEEGESASKMMSYIKKLK